MRLARSLTLLIPLAAASLTAAACGGPSSAHRATSRRAPTAHAAAATTGDEATAPPRGASDPASSPTTAPRAPAAARAPGPLNRAEVEAILTEGLGRFLARVAVSPVLARGRFVGFRLDAAEDLDAWHAAGADIRVGDVILRVNGIRIERPEQALWAFERLRIANEIAVDLLRGGAQVAVRSPILPDGQARP